MKTTWILGCLAVVFLLTNGCISTTTTPDSGAEAVRIGGMPLYAPGVESRAITAENTTGARGAGGQAGEGRKGSPCLWKFAKDMEYTFAEIDGPGVIRHIWVALCDPQIDPQIARNIIFRFYWDGQETPSVEAPITDFFGVSHGRRATHASAFTATPDGKAMNCYFPMPFKKHARLVVCNESGMDAGVFFYQVDYTLGDDVTEETPYFHAQFRRDLMTTMKEDFVILDGVKGKGRFLGANIGIVDRYADAHVWWGEGEVKFYLDGDTAFPTICGTGSEDYAGSAWGLSQSSQPEFGAPVIDGKYISFYRFHTRDPIYFHQDLRVTIQQIGNDGQLDPASPDGPLGEFIARGEYLKEAPGGNFERVDDICATAYWYQTLPTQPFPPLPDKEIRSAHLE